jgi:hypothetical protein
MTSRPVGRVGGCDVQLADLEGHLACVIDRARADFS